METNSLASFIGNLIASGDAISAGLLECDGRHNFVLVPVTIFRPTIA